jgi:hypothetical protein
VTETLRPSSAAPESPGKAVAPEAAGEETPQVPDASIFEDIARNLSAAPGRGDDTVVAVRAMLDRVVDSLGEGWIGGRWDARDDIWLHTTSELDDIVKKQHEVLVKTLRELSSGLDSHRQIRLLLHLWWECWKLWDASLAYRTIELVKDATADFVTEVTARLAQDAAAGAAGPDPATNPGAPQESWEPAAWQAAGAAMTLIVTDCGIFKLINLSRTDDLATRAAEAAGQVERVHETISSALAAIEAPPGQADDIRSLTREGLRFIGFFSRQIETFYKIIAYVTGTLGEFERWIACSPAGDPEHSRPADRVHPCRPLNRDEAPLASIHTSLQRMDRDLRKLTGPTLTECEPWQDLLAELRDLIVGGDASAVLVPKRVWVRYCYPFAVEDNDRSRTLLRPRQARRPGQQSPDGEHFLRYRLRQEFDTALGEEQMVVGEPVNLAQTEFFQAAGDEAGRYSGVRVELSKIEFTGEFLPNAGGDGRGQRCRVWLDFNQMGNFCLCVEAIEPIENPPPHLLYRALRAGTPFVYGETVTLVGCPSGSPPAWDNLETFARDVIRAAADAYFWKEEREPADKKAQVPSAVAPFVRGNVHEIVVTQTAGPLGLQAEVVADTLDTALGGRILLRSTERTASTLEEWVRFPPLQRSEGRVRAPAVVAVPEIGFSGDWYAHAGFTTVFGIVAAPPWLRDVYPETAQFAASWSPLLRLWSKRLHRAINELRLDNTGAMPLADLRRRSAELRRIEQRVRRHLSDINSEELCATLAFRQYLDGLLETAGVGRLEKELEAQLKSAEQLTDWCNENEQQQGARRRDLWLFIIALLGVFSLSDFMLLANTTDLHGTLGFIRLTDDGRWEDWFIIGVFGALIVIAGIVLDVHKWLYRKLSTLSRRLASKLPARERR